MATLPRLVFIGGEERSAPSYHHEGRLRQREYHCVFQYTISGRGVFRDAQGEHEVPAGQGFLCTINDPTTAYYYPNFAFDNWRFLFCCFDGQASRAMVAELVARHGHIYQLPERGGAMSRLIKLGERNAGQEINAAEGASIVMELLLSLAASKDDEGPASAKAGLVRQARQIIDEGTDRQLTVKSVARMLRVSREHLSRSFLEEAGTSPHNYIMRKKVLAACRLLKDTKYSVKEVAARLGYNVPAHFYRAFNREIGLSPARFRLEGIMPVA